MHTVCPTSASAVLALIAAVAFLVRAPAADAQSPCKPWEIYRPSLRMCEAMTDTSAQPTAPSKVVVRKRGSTPPSVQQLARERGRTQPSMEKPASESSRARPREGSGRQGGGPGERPRTLEHHSLAGAESPRLPQPTSTLETGVVSARRVTFGSRAT